MDPVAEKRVRVGTSGWVYPHWKGRFYPTELPARDQLAFYQRHFGAVELNNTFYRLPTPTAVEGWAARAEPGFVFAVKGSRYLTHIKRLKDSGEGVARFFSAIAGLGGHLGPVLWQLPPNLKPDLPRLCAFLEALPDGPAYVVEFRNPDWYREPVFEALADLDVSLCLHDLVDAAAPFPPPGPIYYRRFHGAQGKYGGRYGRPRLRKPAAELAALSRGGVDCFAFFNNDRDADAIHDAVALEGLVAEALAGGAGLADVHR